MVAGDRLTDWDAHPRRSTDRRRSKTTSCAASRARMDGWWTVTAGCTVVVCLDPTAVLMDESPHPLSPAPSAVVRRSSGPGPSRCKAVHISNDSSVMLPSSFRHHPLVPESDPHPLRRSHPPLLAAIRPDHSAVVSWLVSSFLQSLLAVLLTAFLSGHWVAKLCGSSCRRTGKREQNPGRPRQLRTPLLPQRPEPQRSQRAPCFPRDSPRPLKILATLPRRVKGSVSSADARSSGYGVGLLPLLGSLRTTRTKVHKNTPTKAAEVATDLPRRRDRRKSTSPLRRRCTARWIWRSGWRRQRRR